MASLDDFVTLSITSNSTTVSRQGFGTPLILTFHNRFAERYKTYSSLLEMRSAPDLFATTDDAYRMAAACFAQNPAPTKVIVGRLPTAPVFQTALTMTTATQGQVIKAKVIALAAGTVVDPVLPGGVISPVGAVVAGDVISITYTVQAAATLTTVATAFEQFIEAVPGVDSTSAVAVITATPTTAGKKVHIYDIQNCTLEEITVAAGYDTELGNLQQENDDWYGVTIDSQSDLNVQAVATWMLTQKKIFFVGTSQSKELATGTTAGSTIKGTNNKRVAMIWTPNSHEFAGNAWAGLGLPQEAGSINWANKTLIGITAKNLTSNQQGFLVANNVNHYQTLNSRSSTRKGYVSSGEFIDVVHGTDALESRIKEDVYAFLTSIPKLAYTDQAFQALYGVILGAMQVFTGDNKSDTGLLAFGTSVVTIPLVASIPASSRASRDLPGIKFTATYEGAVNSVGIAGVLSI